MRESIRKCCTGVLVVGALAAAGCARGDDAARADSNQAETAAAQGETAATPAATGTAGRAADASASNAPLTAEDIERWERGQRAELKAVEKVLEDLKSAKTATDTLSLQFKVNETVEEGARAAGVSVERYRWVDEQIGQALTARMMGGAMQKELAKVDTTDMPAEMRARMREGKAQMDSAWGDPFKGLSPDVAAVLKRRAAELDTLRWSLVGARMGKTLKGDPKP